ncbi:MAG TPA: hypothetical protein VMW10_00015 [Alphaproteobacteria bacterium]|nr:hypothetical protein [Alphaproteobacteria bacterium]
MKWAVFLLASTLLSSEKGIAQTTATPDKNAKTETIYIPTGKPPPATTENFSQPFFASTTGYEVNEEVEELKSRVEKLEKMLASQAAVKVQPGGTLLIESKGDIEISTPGTVKFNAKSVEMPKQ